MVLLHPKFRDCLMRRPCMAGKWPVDFCASALCSDQCMAGSSENDDICIKKILVKIFDAQYWIRTGQSVTEFKGWGR